MPELPVRAHAPQASLRQVRAPQSFWTACACSRAPRSPKRRCFCFVCDTLAAECGSWGDGACLALPASVAQTRVPLVLLRSSLTALRITAGTDAGHHCHATGDERSWQAARTARQAASAPAPAAHAFGFGGGAYGGGGYGGGAYVPPAPRGPPTMTAGVLPAGHVRQPPSAPEHLPDPATLPSLLHLSSLRLSVRVPEDATHTIGEVQARLAPFGLCAKDSHGSVSSDGTCPVGLRAVFRATNSYCASRMLALAVLRANVCRHASGRTFHACAAGATSHASHFWRGRHARQAAFATHHRAL